MTKLLLLSGLVFATACGSKTDGAISEMQGFTDKMCACTDKGCAEAVMKDMMEFGKKMKDEGVKKSDLSDDQKQKLKDLRKEFEGCSDKLKK
jgi:hypothetical protein